MGKKKGTKQTGHRVYHLTINYRDARSAVVYVHQGRYMAGEPVRVEEKLFVTNGKTMIAPAVHLTMPKHDVIKSVQCASPCKKRVYSRHDH